MKLSIQKALQEALHRIEPNLEALSVELERCRDASHGDFASNVALQYAKKLGEKPRDLAQKIVQTLGNIEGVASIEIAGAGFINFRLAGNQNEALLQAIINEESAFFRPQVTEPKKILLEFVSANPNGPLHVGHGRGAAYGASLANVLRAVGHQLDCEYYVNDAGRQMNLLTLSIYWRYLQLLGLQEALPAGIYQGDYVIGIAEKLKQEQGDKLKLELSDFVPETPVNEENRDAWLDECVFNLRQKLGESAYQAIFDLGLACELADIQDDLSAFNVHFQHFYSERSLFSSGKIDAAFQVLQEREQLYEQGGALWFKASAYGDEKDRVVRRENGVTTYFASDIAYHHDKFMRGYDLMIDVFGADHHGYMARVQACLAALGHDPKRLFIQLVQFAVLYQNGEKIQMSTRSGQFVTLRALRDEVGSDAARFFYVMRKPDQHLDFDLDLARSQNKDNPFYYVEYAHARCCRVLERAQEEGYSWTAAEALPHSHLLNESAEQAVLRELQRYPDVVSQAAFQYAPHMLINYLKELASAWHHYYDSGYKVLHEDANIRLARLLLTDATRRVLRDALQLVGVSALERM